MTKDTTQITNTTDYIDSRDVLERIEFLSTAEDIDSDPGSEDQQELASLTVLIQTIRQVGTGDTPEGHVPIIRDSYFEQFAEEEAESIGAINSDCHWPYNHIDWDAAAKELKSDYVSIGWEGVIYWIR